MDMFFLTKALTPRIVDRKLLFLIFSLIFAKVFFLWFGITLLFRQSVFTAFQDLNTFLLSWYYLLMFSLCLIPITDGPVVFFYLTKKRYFSDWRWRALVTLFSQVLLFVLTGLLVYILLNFYWLVTPQYMRSD